MYLKLDTQFNPFTYDELIKPIINYEKNYKELENSYENLALKTSVWEMLKNNPADKEVYDQYATFNEDLESQIDSLTSNGLTPSVRKNLTGLKSRYMKEIFPIEQAYEARKKHAVMQQEGKIRDNTLMLETPAYETPLSDYINNPQLMFKSQSGALITKRVADALSQYSDSMLQTGKWKSTASGQLLERAQQYGFSREMLNEIMTKPEKYQDIHKIIEGVIDTTGIKNWKNSKTALPEAYMYAYEGLPAGLGKVSIDVRNDQDYLNPYAEWKWEQEKKAAADEEDKNAPKELDAVDRIYTINRDIEKKVKGLLSEEGKLSKTLKRSHGMPLKTPIEISDALFSKEGKFTKPEVIDFPKEGMTNLTINTDAINASVSKEASKYYDDIVLILQSAGLNSEQIHSMDKEQLEGVLNAIASKSKLDVGAKKLYRIKLNSTATKELFGSLNNTPMYKVEGLQENNIKYAPEAEELAYVEGTSGDILFDSPTNSFLLNYGNQLYSLPVDRITEGNRNKLMHIFNPENNLYEKALEAYKAYLNAEYLDEEDKKNMKRLQKTLNSYLKVFDESMKDYVRYTPVINEK